MRQFGVAVVSALLIGACVGQPPTPEPFPIPDVRQLTSDSSFYQELMWSPNGEWIAATRCPILMFQPDCVGNQEPVLVKPEPSEVVVFNLGDAVSDRVNGFPVSWSVSGEKLLLYLSISPTTEQPALSERTSSYMAYDPSGADLVPVYAGPGTVLEWDDENQSVLVLRDADEEGLEIGWHNYSTGDFTRLLTHRETDLFAGFTAVSPDFRTLLHGDSLDAGSCAVIERLDLTPTGSVTPIASMGCFPAWAGNGGKIAYALKDDPRSEPNQLIIANPDGSNPQPLFGGEQIAFLASPTWSPDGSQIAFTKGWLEGVNAIYVASVPERLRP